MRILIVSVLIVFGLFSCEGPKSTSVSNNDATAETVTKKEVVLPNVKDTALIYSNGTFDCEVLIKVPKAPFKGTILVLQGWNFANTSWCENTDLCERASEEGYFLVMPYVGKSIYHKEVYPETRADWHEYPTRTWLMNEVVADLEEKYQLLSEDHRNFVMGLSTGGRGALILAEENPTIFTAGATLSGDYDQSEFPKDNLYKGFFGADAEQWTDAENPVATIEDWQVPLYVGHGAKDSIVSVNHMTHLERLLKEKNPALKTVFHQDDEAGHDYAYWSSELEAIFAFFATQGND